MPRRKKKPPHQPDMPDELKAMGAKLAARREKCGMDRYEVAEKVGAAYSAIGHIEAGRCWPSGPMLIRIKRVLGMSPELV